MTEIKLTEDMLKTLSELKNKNLESIYCLRLRKDDIVVSGNLELNTDTESYEICNYEDVFPFFDKIEDISVFKIRKMDKNEDFKSYSSLGKKTKLKINETIKKVKIISDRINVMNRKYEVECDMAIVFECEKHSYMLSRGVWWSDLIKISLNKTLDDIFSKDEQIGYWNNDGDDARIERIIYEL